MPHLPASRLAVPAAAVALALPGLLGSASAAVPLVERSVWFHCGGDVRQGNAVAAPASWDGERPAALAQGGGCTTLDAGRPGLVLPFVQADSFAASGVVRGALDAVTVTLDNADADAGGARGAVHVSLVVDGRTVVAREVVVQPAAGAAGTRRYAVTVTGIGLVGEDDTGDHRVSVRVDGVGQTANAWAYDAAELDGGLVLNPRRVVGAVVRAS